MDFKFIIAADIHLDSPMQGLSRYEGAPVDALRGATRQALSNLVSLAIEEKAAFVLLSGDLYDGDWRDYHTGLFLMQQLSRLREAGVKVFVIYGNHDAESRITKSLHLPENVRVLSTKSPETVLLEDFGVAIHGQGFAKRDVMENLADQYPDARKGFFNIGMLHTALTGAEGHAPYAPCTLGTLRAKGYDVWALGHVHARKVHSEEPLILFPGNTQGRHARETGPKGCTLVSVEDSRLASFEHKDLHVVRWEVIPVDASGHSAAVDVIDAAVAAVKSESGKGSGEGIAARLHIQGACRAHRELLADSEKWTAEIRAAVAAATGEGAWIEKVRLMTVPEADLSILGSGSDPLSDLVRYINGLSASEEVGALLTEDIRTLKEKLPPELFQGEGAIVPDSPEGLSGLLEEVKGMLVQRVLASGVGK
jgi:DNA repair exonuclease SbcCD nuclease subunit